MNVGEGDDGQETQAHQGQHHQLVQIHLANNLMPWQLLMLLVGADYKDKRRAILYHIVRQRTLVSLVDLNKLCGKCNNAHAVAS
jgi:hypothetical protein